MSKISVAAVVIAVAIASVFIWQKSSVPGGVACTADAKLCPDGSAVGRTGPKCEFAPCPGESIDLWKTFTDSETGISFRYPEALTTKYISALDWPPKLQLFFKPFTCTSGGSETARTGRTEERTVDDRTYCVTAVTEGAAGSIYTQYTYAFPTNSGAVIFTFSLRSVQCGNYGEPEKTECENEQESFDLDGLVDRIAATLKSN